MAQAEDREERTVPPRAYYLTFAGLCGLLALTIIASSLDLGVFNPVLAVGIGATKALLIIAYFMHLRVSRSLILLVAGAVLIWVWIMFVLILTDYFTRHAFELPLF